MVFGLVGLLAAAGLLAPVLPVELVLTAGALCSAAGLLVGIPTGLWYHVELHACLRRHGELPAHWWVHPVALHPLIPETCRGRVMAWFYVGGLGFLITVLGCGIVVLGILLVAFRQPV